MSVSLPRSLLLILGCAAAACAQPRDDGALAATGCSVRVIVTLRATPDDALVADLARVSGAQLELVRTMTSNLHLFTLTAAGRRPECTAAIERLRRDPRVRAVDLDQRREIHRRREHRAHDKSGKTDHAHQFVRRRSRCRSPSPRARSRSRHATREDNPALRVPDAAADLGDAPGIIVKFRSAHVGTRSGTSRRRSREQARRARRFRDSRGACAAGRFARAQGGSRAAANRSPSSSRACARTPTSNSRSPIGAAIRTRCRTIRSTPASGICRTASTRRARCTRKLRGTRARATRAS